MNLADIPIGSLIPQAPPFVFVDRLVFYEGSQAICEYTVPAGGYLCEGGCLSTAGMVEAMAQTCAAQLGYYQIYVCRGTVKKGYIAAVQGLRVLRHPEKGECLRISVNVEIEFGNVKHVSVGITVENCVLASAEMKIFEVS